MRTKLLVTVLGLLEAAGAVSAATANVAVTLAAKGSTHREPGQAIALVARARLPAGDRILVEGKRTSDTAPFKVKECGTSPCAASWREQEAGSVSFSALVVRHSGPKLTILGRSKPIGATWRSAAPPPPPPSPPPPPAPPAPAPPPPPALPATAGHYSGVSGQGYQVAVDVPVGGSVASSVVFTRVDLPAGSCSAAGLGDFSGIYFENVGFRNVPISASGTFAADSTFNQVDPDLGPYTVTLHVTGQFNGASIAGAATLTMKFNYQGVDQNCSAGMSWSASR